MFFNLTWGGGNSDRDVPLSEAPTDAPSESQEVTQQPEAEEATQQPEVGEAPPKSRSLRNNQ